MFPRSVTTTRRVYARVRILRDGCVHTFLTYEVMSMHNFKHMTPCLWFNFPQVHSKQPTTSRLFNLRTLLTMQHLTYKDVSVCKLSHMRTCLFATCHKIYNVLSRPPCFHANVSTTRLVYVRTVMRFYCEKTSLYATFWLTLSYPQTNFLIGGRVCIQLVT